MAAQKLGYRWVDLDELILLRLEQGTTIRSFFQTKGKSQFMQLEYESLADYLKTAEQPTIISLGGGACDNEALVQLIKREGSIIYLMVPQQVLLKRILAGGVPPFLDPNNVELSFSRLYKQRDERYGTIADYLIHLPDYPDVQDTAEYLVKHLKNEV